MQLSAASAMEPALTLANTPLDLQITICIFLYPADILALRKTCRALEIATRQRTVWMAVLHRICLDNTLFLPSFPIPDMSDLELERAAMAPRRWIELCDTFQIRHSNDFSEMLRPRTTRILKDMIIDSPVNEIFIVPGGRYLVTAGNGLFVWDLGYVSTVDCKLVASVGLGDNFEFCKVQATPDGMGLVILTSYKSDYLSIFEIFPQSEIAMLTQIAHLDWIPPVEVPTHLLPDALICCHQNEDMTVFRVVDYRTNYSTRFSVDVDRISNGPVKTFATKTAIIVFCLEEILIWAIPPLSPQPSDLPDYSLFNKFTHIPPLFKIPFPDGIVRHESFEWMILSTWYFGSWESVYFGILFSDLKLQKLKIIIKPDLSDASLHFINTYDIISDELTLSIDPFMTVNEGYRICEDALVFSWNNDHIPNSWGAYTGLTSAPFTNAVMRWNGHVDALCPTSGRFVYLDGDASGRLSVVDLF